MRSPTLAKITQAGWNKSATSGTCVLLFWGVMTSFAQAPMPAMPPQPRQATADASGQNSQADQIAELRAQIAKLQAAMQQPGSRKKSDATPGMKMAHTEAMNMPMMGDKGEMGGMPGDAQSIAPAGPASAMGMCCMGKMGGGSAKITGGAAQPAGGMAGMSGPSSAMPGQPGTSHLYHIGSTGFFLNHPRHITLTEDQKMTLNRLQDKAMLDRASAQGRIDQAEQELYTLTAADQPGTSKIQAKVNAIEKLRGDQRMNFIRAVGEATTVISPEQRQVLLGAMAANQK